MNAFLVSRSDISKSFRNNEYRHIHDKMRVEDTSNGYTKKDN